MRNFLPFLVIFLIILSPFLTYEKTDETITTSAKNTKYEILVDVRESKLYLISEGNIEKTYKCSGGKWTTPSPVGTWKIIQKAKWGEGFGGSWMGINVPWGKFRNTRNSAGKFFRVGEFSWMYKNE